MTVLELLKLNVNEHTEKKVNLTYLSWAWAWAEALKADPKATFKVEMFNDKCYMDINGTAMVWVTVTLFDKPMTCQLPVMDYKNKAITNPDAFQVNTAIMRCMTKALGLHGLGLYIYAGEDLPEEGRKGPGPIITPRGKQEISEERKIVIFDVEEAINERIDHDDMIGAYEEYIGITDPDEKLFLWGLLTSKTRSAIKKHGDSLKQGN